MERRLELQMTPDEAFAKVQEAFAKVGKVQEASPSIRFVRGHIRSGLGWDEIRVSIISSAEGSLVEVQGNASIDPYGYERRALSKLISALSS